MQKNTIRQTKAIENQQVQKHMSEQAEVELNDAELARISGAAGTSFHPYIGRFNDYHYNRYFRHGNRWGHHC
ncbi:MAG TPA: hypothetical protein VL485_07960 [Ktedonobacteraceae bacterium]|nr:hypothetical protein [Ktedonobacteraceae bacterium]